MSDPQAEDDSEELSQDAPGPRLSVWAPILLTAVVIGGLVWWIQSDSDTVARRRPAGEAPGTTADIVLPASPGGASTVETEVALAPMPAAAPAAAATAAPAPPSPAEAAAPPADTAPAVDAAPAVDTAPTVDTAPAVDTATEAPIIVAPPAVQTAAVATTPVATAPVSAAPPAGNPPASTASEAPTTDVTTTMTVSPGTAAPVVSASDTAPANVQEPTLVAPSTALPTAAVSDVPVATRIESGTIEAATVSDPPPALPTQPPPSPEPIAALQADSPTAAATAAPSISTRSGPPTEPMPTVPVSAPAEIAASPPALPAEPGIAVLPVHRMPIVQPSEASDDADLKTTSVAAGAEAVVKAEDVVPAKTVEPVTIPRDGADAPTASVTAPQPPLGTLDPGAPVMAEASRTNNAGSAPAAPPSDVSPGSANVGDAKATDAGVIVAETLDPATLGIIVPPDATGGAAETPPADAPAGAPAPTGAAEPGAAEAAPGIAAATGSADDEHGTIVAEDVDPASLGLVTDDAGPATTPSPATTPPAATAADTGRPVVAALPPSDVTTAIVAETLDLSALDEPGSAPAEEPAAAAPAAPAAAPAAATDRGPLPMVAALGAIEPPQPAWQRFATTVVDPAGGRPTISVIVDGLGQSVLRTRMAIEMLPQAVALAFDPYAPAVADLAAAAQAGGHEVLMSLPMEPARGSADVGPEALGLGLTVEENADRLGWILGRARDYVGVLAPAGAELTRDEAGMAPIVESLRRQGLMVVTWGPDDLAGTFPADLPQASVDRHVDLPDDTGLYDAAFADAEAAAKSDGHVVVMVSPYPSAMRGVAAWLATLPGKGLALAPVTAAAIGREAAAAP